MKSAIVDEKLDRAYSTLMDIQAKKGEEDIEKSQHFINLAKSATTYEDQMKYLSEAVRYSRKSTKDLDDFLGTSMSFTAKLVRSIGSVKVDKQKLKEFRAALERYDREHPEDRYV